MTTFTEVLAQLDRQREEITHQQATIETEIRDSSKRHDIIDHRQGGADQPAGPDHQEKAEKSCSTERQD